LPNLVPAIVPEEAHTLPNRHASDHAGIRSLHNDFTDFRSHRQKFKYSYATEVPGAAASIATYRIPYSFRILHTLNRRFGFGTVETVKRDFFSATHTQPTH
jgi:hypothetical protein